MLEAPLSCLLGCLRAAAREQYQIGSQHCIYTSIEDGLNGVDNGKTIGINLEVGDEV